MSHKDKNIALLAYSGHAYVVADILIALGYNIIGYFDKNEATNNPFNIEYLGLENDETVKDILKGAAIFPAVGNNQLRKKMVEMFEKLFLEQIVLISPDTKLAGDVKINNSTLVCRGALINPLADIGKGVIINTGAIIEHECLIRDFAHIAPGATLTGNVEVGEASFIGANSTIINSVKIGNNAIIGAGSVVLSNVPDNEVWAGNPAKKIKNNG